MTDPGSIRNLEQLQEDDDRKMPRGVTMAFVALGGACVVFAGLALGGRTTDHATRADPLGDLVAQRSHPLSPGSSAARRGDDLLPSEVTFPRMLSDEERPATALAAVHPSSPRASAVPGASPPPTPAQPPPPADRLPVVPLPAQSVLEATSVVTHPRDALTKAASEAAQLDSLPPPSAEDAPPGHAGGYQLQVSSFRTPAEAQGFSEQLRARGHKSYVIEAHVPGRGAWFRVRIGPFPTQHAAQQYRAGFEAREHVVPFIVAPETTAKAH